MDELADRIRRQLERWPYAHALVDDDELIRIWPNENNRRHELEEFAKKHDFRLHFYIKGSGAIFDKPPPE